MEQAGQLLISRQHLTLAEGITTVDTGLTQVNTGLDPDPPLGGEDPTASSPGIASRVMVVPLAPLTSWNTGNIHHGEPYVDPATGTVKVDFWVEAGAGAQDVNVEFWDPHTEVCPVDADVYATFACATPDAAPGSAESDTLTPAFVGNTAAAGEQLLVLVVIKYTADFDAGNTITPDQAGWTTLRQTPLDQGGGAGLLFAAFVRTATGADPATWEFSYTDTGNQAWQALPVIVTGSVPVANDAAPGTNATPATPFPLSAPSLTAAAPLPQLLFVFYACDNAGGSWTLPAGMTALGQNEPSGSISFFTCSESIAAAGATGTRDTEYDAGADGGFAYAVMLEPACGIFPDGTGG